MTRSAAAPGRIPGSRFAPLIGALAALVVTAVVIVAIRAGGGGGPADGDENAEMGAVTVEAIPDSVRDEIPNTWSQPRNDPSGTGVWGPDVGSPMDTLWRIHTGMEFFAAPALCGGTLYFGGNDGVFMAVSAADGSRLWAFGTSCGLNGEAAVSDSAVFFCGQDGYVYSLDRASGSLRWKAGLGYHIFASVGLLCDTILVTGNSEGSIAALSAASGDLLWSASPGGVILGPALADTIAVFTSEDGIACAYGAGGNELWRRDFSAQASAPSIGGSSVYIGFSDGVVRRIDLASGTVVWETDLVHQPVRTVISRPVLSGGRVFAGTCDSRVVCLSEEDGSLQWDTPLENWVQLPPAVGAASLYVCSDDQRFHVLDVETGEIRCSIEMGGYSGTAPILANGTVYFGTASGDFFAFRGTLADDGEEP